MAGALVAIVARGLPSVQRTRVSDIDWLGGLLLVGALSLLLLGFSHLHEGPESFEAGAPYHLSVHVGAVVVMALFVWRQLRVDHPLLQLRLLRIPSLSTGVVANGIAHSSMLATSLLLPFLLERGRGYSPTQTAELVVTMQVCLIAGSIGGGVLLARYGPSGLGVGSMAGIAAGLFALGQIGAALPFAALFPLVAGLGTAQGTFTAVNNTAVMSSLGADQRGFASGLVEMTRHLGHALGTSISSSVLVTSLAAAIAPAAGYRDGFAAAATTMAAVAALGIVVVLYPTLRSRIKLLSPGIEPQRSTY
jgi:predicted MFS family arabinose efflux permease